MTPNPAEASRERKAGAEGREPSIGAPRRLLVDGLHLAALSAFALSQPLFDLLGKNPEFFAARGSQSEDIIVFALAVTLVPPAVLLLVEALAGLASLRLRRALHIVFVAGLAAVVFMQVLKRADGLSSEPIIVGAALLGALAALAYRQSYGLRTFLTVLSPAPLVFLVLFLVFSPVSRLTFANEAEARAGRVGTESPIVLVAFDEFPLTTLLDEQGRIDAERYPSFARFAQDATWFRNATGVADRTTSAIPAILDGKAPDEKALPIAADHPDNLFTLVGGEYEMNVHEAGTNLCPAELCRGSKSAQALGGRLRSLTSDLSVVYGHLALPEGLADRLLPSVTNTLGGFQGEGQLGEGAAGSGAGGSGADAGTDEAPPRGGGQAPPAKARRTPIEEAVERAVAGGGRAAAFEDWLGGIHSGERPTLNFNHVFLPHIPWQYLPSGRRYAKEPSEPIPGLAERKLDNEFVLRQTHQRHLLQTEFTDRVLGRLLDTLEQRGMYDDALVVLVADHGAYFRTGHDRRIASPSSLVELASVPFLVKAPNQSRGQTSDAYARTTDVVPTIADVLDIRLPWRPDGVSAFSTEAERRRTVAMLRGSEPGGTPEISTSEFERRQALGLRRKLSLFGAGEAPEALYGFGPYSGLVGARVRELSAAPAGETRADVAEAGRLRTVDLRSDFLPALVTGRIEGAGTPEGNDLAFALNGRIVATGESFSLEDGSTEQFASMLPESAFRQGANELAVYAVSGPPGAARLQLLGRS